MLYGLPQQGMSRLAIDDALKDVIFLDSNCHDQVLRWQRAFGNRAVLSP